MADKKGIYHSELRKAGPVRVTVEHEAQESSKKKGSYYVTLKIDGQTRYYTPENQACMDFFNGTKGKTFTIIADGGGKGQEDSATIEYVGEQVSEAKPRTAAPANRPAAARGPAAPRRGPTPHNTTVPPGHPQHQPAAQPARPAAALQRPPQQASIHGATVGMCMKEALTVVNAMGIDPFSEDYVIRTWHLSSDLIRLAQALESGKLAPKLVDRMAKA